MVESRHMPIGKELDANLWRRRGTLRLRPLSVNFTPGGRLAGNGKGRTISPLHGLSLPPLPPISPHSFEATCDARCAARHNHVTVGIEDFKGNCISERVPVNTDLDSAGESVCLYPDPGRAKNEGVGDRAVIVALGVPPGTQTGRG